MGNINIDAKIHNRFDIEVVDAKTGEVKQRAQAFNVILDKMWNSITSGYFTHIHYGTGTGTPSASDTSLFTFLGAQSASNIVRNMNYSDGVFSLRKSIQLTAATAVGSTLTEVGIASETASSTLVTHAMLQDMNGNPISILKTDTDVINIYATVYVHFNPEGYGGIYPIYTTNSPGNAFFAMLAGDSYGIRTSGRFEAFYKQGAVSGSSATVTHTVTKSTTNRQITFAINRLEASAGNFGGLCGVIVNLPMSSGSGSGSNPNEVLLLIPGGSGYPYSTITNEAVGTGDGATKDFSLDFPYAHNATIYVDGIAQSGVTIDYAPNTATFTNYMIPCANSTHMFPTISTSNNWRFYYNPAYAVGLRSLYCTAGDIDVSDDLQTWTTIGTRSASGTFSIPQEHQHHKYYRFKRDSGSAAFNAPSSFTGNVVHFDTAPADGAVITADYQCDCIAKDENHVFDLTITLQLGEYEE